MIAAAATVQDGPDRPIGGFFERHDPDGAAKGESLLRAWTGDRPYAAFVNARSAFATLVAAFPEAVVWLPAFLCADLLHPSFAARVRFYPVRAGFEPDLEPVARDARSGDMVLAVSHFGLPTGPGLRALSASRPDLRIVEDRAQALDAGAGIDGSWRLFSPRKLLGVADGGLLVAPNLVATLPRPTQPADAAALWRPPLLRYQDPLGRDNAVWHAANRAKEAAMTVGAQAMSGLSLSILTRTSLRSLAERRLANWRALDARLRPWSALPAEPHAPPLGYVLRLDPAARDRLLSALHEARIFAAVHWPRIAAPAEAFPREQAWTRELLTLPCDHRYGEAEMERIARRVLDRLG